MRLSTIYIIRNRINNKVYIGQTVNSVEERWEGHLKRYRSTGRTYKLHGAMRKHGIENFYYETLEVGILPQEINSIEREYIERYDSFNKGYNATKGGDGALFSEIEEGEIASLYLSGLSSIELADLYDVSWRTIIRILEKHRVERRSRDGVADKEEFTEMYLKGIPLKDIALYYLVDLKTVTRTRNRLGLPKRLNNKRREDVETIREE